MKLNLFQKDAGPEATGFVGIALGHLKLAENKPDLTAAQDLPAAVDAWCNTLPPEHGFRTIWAQTVANVRAIKQQTSEYNTDLDARIGQAREDLREWNRELSNVERHLRAAKLALESATAAAVGFRAALPQATELPAMPLLIVDQVAGSIVRISQLREELSNAAAALELGVTESKLDPDLFAWCRSTVFS